MKAVSTACISGTMKKISMGTILQGSAFQKNQSDHSNWDGIHVFEVTTSPSSPDNFNYRVTTTIILHLDKAKTDQNSHMILSRNLTRQTEKDIANDMSRPLDIIFHITLISLI
ncbi:AVN_HP_G0119940.mRNA.1.CDS.1 [Saccharomyces cerevisiae]|nr:AVN_HP_G0119940.mRNA.1.CDS.1 [Saccharomyces cerevisiae]CAI6997042.1 AVN_HP_G0119940.mRNA.1.CDS.1 [Saccharomyces cerevisiae]